MEKRFEWHYKKLSRSRIRKKKYRDKPDEDYKLVSYEEAVESNEESRKLLYGRVQIEEMKYDDNFDLITFDWSLKEPMEFVDDYELFMATSSLTTKQMEVFSLELEGYIQEQIADNLRASGVKISQQGVNERLLGVRKKIDKIQSKRGNQNGRENGNHSA
ncbi:hypothetical protein D1872_236710 [compost metagenome]